MNPFLILKSEFRQSKFGILAIALVLALSVSLSISLSVIERGLRQGYAQAGDNFDLVIGAKGSDVQLILGAVYLQKSPLSLIEYDVFEEIIKSDGVDFASPLAFGDMYNGYPLVGTNQQFATFGDKRKLAEGRVFAAHTEAVIGAGVKLQLHEEFSPVHGNMVIPDGNEVHGHTHFEVVGRLPHTGTPYDQAILVPVESIWEMHGLEKSGVSAIVVKPKTIADAYKLRSKWQSKMLSSVFTGEVLTDLFATLGDVRIIMEYMAIISQITSLFAVILVSIFAIVLRKDILNLLRTLGAPRIYLLFSVWGIVALNIIIGSVIGLLLGYTIAIISTYFIQIYTLTFIPVILSMSEVYLLLIFMAIGLIFSFLPALTIYYRKNSYGA